MLLLFFAGLAAHRVHVQARAHGLRAAGRSGLLPHHRADSAWRLALLHRPTSPTRRAAVVRRRRRRLRHLLRHGLSALSAAARPTPASSSSRLKPVDERTRKGRAIQRAESSAIFAASSSVFLGGIVFASEPPAIAGHRHLRRLPVHAAGRRPQHLQDIDRVAHTIVGQSAARITSSPDMNTTFTSNDPQLLVTIDREKAKALGVSVHPDHRSSGHLHGIELRQRLRLQQPLLSRLRAGRRAVPSQPPRISASSMCAPTPGR